MSGVTSHHQLDSADHAAVIASLLAEAVREIETLGSRRLADTSDAAWLERLRHDERARTELRRVLVGDVMRAMVDRVAVGDDREDPSVIGAVYESLLDHRPVVDLDAQTLTLKAGVRGARRSGGVFYTPATLVAHLLDSALEPVIDARLAGAADPEQALLGITICDPACGTGNFLVAAARRLAERLVRLRSGGSPPTDAMRRGALRDVIARCVHGVDIDPMAVELCRATLWLESGDGEVVPGALERQIKVGNALIGATPAQADAREPDARERADAWCAAFVGASDGGEGRPFFHWHLEFPAIFAGDAGPGGFDVVVGNPPFLNQLETTTVAARGHAALLTAVTRGAVRGYTDTSAAFLLLATRICRDGGRVAMVQPQSLLAAKDAGRVRTAVLRDASLVSLWIANERVFASTGVLTCAPTLERGGPRRGTLTRFTHGRFERLDDMTLDNDELEMLATWSDLVADARGVPTVHVRSECTIGDIADATADFRDQYYGLEGFIVENLECRNDPMWPPIVTSGLIDLAHCRWEWNATRILKRQWNSPRVDRARMEQEGELGVWISQRLVPKVLVATQTRVIEVFVDAAGRFLPSVPLITVRPHDTARIWHVAAALASPVCAAIALSRYGGVALAADTIKLSARQVLELPIPELPIPGRADAWHAAAKAMRKAHEADGALVRVLSLQRMAKRSIEAYGVSPDEGEALLAWWTDRLSGGRYRGDGR